MNTRYLMMASSLVLGVAGVAASFAPQELLAMQGIASESPLPLLVQLLGAVYLAFGLMNWTAKDNMIGGIYARPISLGNFLHFVMGALAIGKAMSGELVNAFGVGLLSVYVIFALAFGWLLFGGVITRKMGR